MFGDDGTVAKSEIESLKHELECIIDIPGVEAVLLFGSKISGNDTSRSDTDVCIVAPKITEKKEQSQLLGKIWQHLNPDVYDVWLFEELPLYMKMSVISNHIIVACRDIPALFEYFYPFRKIWADQAHRQIVKF